MDISQLVTLVHVAELGSLSKAADRLHIVRPALSRQVRLLEEELGVTLFHRHGRGMSLTVNGQQVLEHATRVLSELEAMRRAVEPEGRSLRGQVRVGLTPTVGAILTVPLVRRVRAEHPELAVRLTTAFSGTLVDWLKRGEIDVAMTYDPPPTRALLVIPVMHERLHLVSAHSDVSLQASLPFACLSERELVLPSPGHGLRTIIDECGRTAQIKLSNVVEADSFAALIDLTRAGFGDTILPLTPLHDAIVAGQLFSVPLVEPIPRRRLVVCLVSDRPVDAAARYIGETTAQIASDFVRRGLWSGELISF